jgi:transposase, IS30 family
MPYNHLTENERYVISHLSVGGYSIREIARRINRHHTTVSRELRRHDGTIYEDTTYWYNWTHPEALKRRQKPRHTRRRSNKRLVNYVEHRLKNEIKGDVGSKAT